MIGTAQGKTVATFAQSANFDQVTYFSPIKPA